MGFSRKFRGLALLHTVKSSDILSFVSQLFLSQHRTATTPHKTISTALVRLCDTNVPRANGKATNGCSFEWQKAQRATQNSLAELCGRPGIVPSWNSTSKIAASCRRSGCLEIPIRLAAPATPKEQAG